MRCSDCVDTLVHRLCTAFYLGVGVVTTESTVARAFTEGAQCFLTGL